MISKVYRVQTDNREINQLQINLINGVNALVSLPLNQGVLLQNISLLAASNPNVINHTLGRDLIGWILTRVRASSTIYDTQTNNSNPGSTLFLKCSADVTVDLFCF